MAITLDGTTGIVAQAIDVVTPITVSDGGTGLIAVGTSGNILTSNGTSWESTTPSASLLNTAVTPGTTGNVLTSDGTSWTSIPGPSGMVYLTDTQTLTNKRITPRIITTTSNANPVINTDVTDIYGLTDQTEAITSFTTNLTGSPTNGQKLWIYIVGTAAMAITWGAKFESSTVTLPTTTVSTNRLDVGFVWNAVSLTWRCVAVS